MGPDFLLDFGMYKTSNIPLVSLKKVLCKSCPKNVPDLTLDYFLSKTIGFSFEVNGSFCSGDDLVLLEFCNNMKLMISSFDFRLPSERCNASVCRI